jgi:hypothetical protein
VTTVGVVGLPQALRCSRTEWIAAQCTNARVSLPGRDDAMPNSRGRPRAPNAAVQRVQSSEISSWRPA